MVKAGLRRRIWEKKYGRHAKHVVRAREVDPAPRDPRGPRTDWPPEGAARAPAPFIDTNSSARVVIAHEPAPKSLHPSWEAAKLRQQKEKSNLQQVKATKIVFD